jgi:tetratricopeptide (TPR) repeat protein
MDQGKDYCGLKDIYFRLNNLNEADISYMKAFKIHEICNNVIGQGNDCRMLGYVYLKLNDPDEAKSFFKRSLELYEHVNDFLGQGHAYYGLKRHVFEIKQS